MNSSHLRTIRPVRSPYGTSENPSVSFGFYPSQRLQCNHKCSLVLTKKTQISLQTIPEWPSGSRVLGVNVNAEEQLRQLVISGTITWSRSATTSVCSFRVSSLVFRLCVFSVWRREVEDQRPVDGVSLSRVRRSRNTICCLLTLRQKGFTLVHCLPSLLSIVFADFFLMNLILWGEGSSAAMPFGTLVAILALWFCVSVPLTFVGAYFGFKKTVRSSIIDLLHGECLFTHLFEVLKWLMSPGDTDRWILVQRRQ